MSHKSPKIAALIKGLEGRGYDPHYLGFFECFNRQQFYEAHDVLEELWLPSRHGPNDHFFKALIQLAGAFVHLQKNRLKPAGSLFRLARGYFAEYPASHENLDVAAVIELIDDWLGRLESFNFEQNPLIDDRSPQVRLKPGD